jgi:hypothetical protein
MSSRVRDVLVNRVSGHFDDCTWLSHSRPPPAGPAPWTESNATQEMMIISFWGIVS